MPQISSFLAPWCSPLPLGQFHNISCPVYIYDFMYPYEIYGLQMRGNKYLSFRDSFHLPNMTIYHCLLFLSEDVALFFFMARGGEALSIWNASFSSGKLFGSWICGKCSSPWATELSRDFRVWDERHVPLQEGILPAGIFRPDLYGKWLMGSLLTQVSGWVRLLPQLLGHRAKGNASNRSAFPHILVNTLSFSLSFSHHCFYQSLSWVSQRSPT